MNNLVVESIYQQKYKDKCLHLCKDTIISFLTNTLTLLFPQMGQNDYKSLEEVREQFESIEKKLQYTITCLTKELNYRPQKNIVEDFFNELLKIEKDLSKDAEFILQEDPACQSINEVIICYPGFFAMAVHRIAHKFYELNTPLLPRILAEYAHEKTGIDIHPGAKIESPIYIDHGTGIVIGESTIIGKNCKIFQGVTLGALSVKRKYKDKKRHPTIGDNCLIYANATILGGKTRIGNNSIIGGNVWITESIPDNAQVYRKHKPDIEIIND